MSFVSSWYANKRVLHIHLEGQLTAQDIETFRQTASTWHTKRIIPLHIIVDEREATGPASSRDAFYEVLDTYCTVSGWKLIICHDAELPGWANMLVIRRWKSPRTRKFAIMGAALAFLRNQDPVLPRLMLQQEFA